MKDPRLETLAKNLINYSVELKKGEKLYLEIKGKDTLDLAKEIITEATKVGATPFMIYNDSSLMSRFLKTSNKEQVEALADLHLGLMKQSQAYLGIRGDDNAFDMSDVPFEKMKLYQEIYINKVHMKQRLPHTKWCVLRYPNPSMATLAEKNQDSFEDFYFKVCNLDYAKLSSHMQVLKSVMENTKKVRLVSPGTDLSFSIENIPAIVCDGKLNIPDGEVYTAPVKDSINGTIKFNSPALKEGVVFNNIQFEFKNGKIIKATCDGNTEKLNEILSIDEGAKYTGEFAIGVNPYILDPMRDTLFDEKIWGSIHLTPGNCYDDASNGNKSKIHWDLVLIQTPEYGGGEVYFDDNLVRKDGEFVHPELKNFTKETFRSS